MSKQSLDEIFEQMWDDYAQALGDDAAPDYTAKAKQAIVEAVEGLANIKQAVPPTNGLDPDGYDQGRKDAVADFLQAIKEWQ